MVSLDLEGDKFVIKDLKTVKDVINAVSYTHLTLPTSDLV